MERWPFNPGYKLKQKIFKWAVRFGRIYLLLNMYIKLDSQLKHRSPDRQRVHTITTARLHPLKYNSQIPKHQATCCLIRTERYTNWANNVCGSRKNGQTDLGFNLNQRISYDLRCTAVYLYLPSTLAQTYRSPRVCVTCLIPSCTLRNSMIHKPGARFMVRLWVCQPGSTLFNHRFECKMHSSQKRRHAYYATYHHVCVVSVATEMTSQTKRFYLWLHKRSVLSFERL